MFLIFFLEAPFLNRAQNYGNFYCLTSFLRKKIFRIFTGNWNLKNIAGGGEWATF